MTTPIGRASWLSPIPTSSAQIEGAAAHRAEASEKPASPFSSGRMGSGSPRSVGR
jgi:hypothetical protein